jgi:iron complex outermembrane receptor protein
MRQRHRQTGRWIGWLTAVLLLAWPAAAAAQDGDITGRVVDESATPVQGAQVQVLGARLGSFTRADGTFRISGVPAGTYTLEVRQPGFQGTRVEDVEVRAGQTARIEVTVTRAPYELAGLVVSASRQTERVTDAPATITKIESEDILNSVGNSFNGALKEVHGLEYIQTGITAVAVNARGFNSSFNNRMLMLEDGRVAVLPENGLPVGQFTAIPKVDLESVEALVGPGASLYGQDASNGVISLQTKDPKEYPGTIVEVAKGTNDYSDVQFRHADVTGDGHWGYKVSAEWQEADDFSNRLQYEAGDELVPEVDADWTTSVARAEGSVVYYDEDVNNLRIEATGGWSESDAIGQTNVGRNQIEDWSYSFQQLRASTDNLYFSAYRTHSQSGGTFALNQFTLNRLGFPDLSRDSVRKLSDFPSDADLFAADFQHNFRVPELLDTRVVWGGQYRNDQVSSKRQWLTDRFTQEDIGIDQGGIFAQTETPLTSKWDLTLGARWDDHQDYPSQFSPTAGISFSPTPDQTLRVTFREAFKSPTTLQTRFFIPDFVPFVGVFGNREGFTVVDGDGNVVNEVDPLVPEVNETWELGYKGVLGERFYLDAALWYADYQDFLGSLLPINNPFADPATFAQNADGEIITGDTGPQLVLTYQNQGNAELVGLDMGASYAVTSDVLFKGTFSWLDLSEAEEAPAVNAPPVTWTVGADFDNLFGDGFAGFLVRHTTGYPFASGINDGKIPTFETADVHLGYDLPWEGMEVRLQAHNLFTCRTLESTGGVAIEPPHLEEGETLDGSHACGFDVPHVEMINMPGIETTVFLGLRWRS